MPIYEFKCAACGKKFDLLLSLKERDKKVKCPECSSDQVERQLSSFFAPGAGGASCTASSCAGCSGCGGSH
ncbi:putative regulatory protein, FmdB family [Thermosyntropha lipolytica DSM 11003]|uniref:Putative regulatory protein, FmdB family n=1 Tax=Thermosyntropha lipolytica DSM 11003 TaxID=1123382 RepID=A0A1M5QAX0_9FIRM|nr:zinc ribbon domain-containing protein [Thermosyntropha lipolytica]SHH10889.1 putative regulatory protein, FmdB family [Thermosyntropha lipolytica DSM 11003]